MMHKPFRKWRVLILLLLLFFVAIQFIRPSLPNPPVTAEFAAPAPVKAILQRACYDCHSNETRLLWFDQLVPAYWLVVKDVREGRKVLNFSTLDSLPKAQQTAKLFESIFQIEQEAMPLGSYKSLHHGTSISPEDLALLKQYALTLAYQPHPDTIREKAWIDQYGKWLKFSDTLQHVQDEYNGISYKEVAGFAGWTAISTTERYDNGTLRLILGNDVVIKAIREGHTNPWPDGAILAKVAWDQLPDTNGVIRSGAFKQVEFIIRDQQKYASTFGWGWARWVGGLNMKPYGKDASFVTECMNCHRPLDKTDHTFTFPLRDTLGLLSGASGTPGDTRETDRRVITSFVDKTSGMMSTLYGNDLAYRAARSGQSYGPGDTLTLVTWLQREDPHWFGGRIPGGLHAVEHIYFTAAGKPASGDAGMSAQRMMYIAGLRAAVLP